jgi:hypothetical protein
MASGCWELLCTCCTKIYTCCCCYCWSRRDYEIVKGSTIKRRRAADKLVREQKLIKPYSGEEVVRGHPSSSSLGTSKSLGMKSGEDSDTLYEVAGPVQTENIKIKNPGFQPYKEIGSA